MDPLFLCNTSDRRRWARTMGISNIVRRIGGVVLPGDFEQCLEEGYHLFIECQVYTAELTAKLPPE